MRNWWLRFGCFLTGYNYGIVRASSEIAAKTVKRYTSALLIVCILWSFIGYMFTARYLKAESLGAVMGALLMMTIIIQVERQIILSTHKNWGLYVFRGLIAITMAVIGSIIIDQIIFKEDIDQQKITLLDEKVKRVLPAKSEELKRQIGEMDSTILVKEQDRMQMMNDISKNPTQAIYTSTSSQVPITSSQRDSANNIITNTSLKTVKTVNVNSIPNPKITLMGELDKQITYLREQKAQKDSMLLTLRPKVEAEIKSKVGFLDELNVMWALIAGSGVAAFVYILWFVLLVCLELFILFSKIGEKGNDYDKTIHHQMDLQNKKLDLLAQSSIQN